MTEKMTTGEDAAALLQRVAPALKEARQQLEAMQRRAYEPIAIVGLGLRFPGADSPRAFWELLQSGVDMVTEIPSDRWAVDDYYDPQPGRPDKMYIRQAAFVDDVDKFDASFFDVSPREAASLDPQHRMLLEVAWEAFERAGIASDQLIDSQTGVFVGMGENDYARLENTGDRYNVYATTGNSNYFAAGRLSYLLGLQGPNLIVDTACSSSLVAVHLACQSLRLGECGLALAGGIQLMLMPDPMIATAQLNAFAPDGRCKTFDAAADGYGRGEGCGVIVLKRISDALAADDPILAVLRGSAVNHGGRGSGLTSPNKLAQEALLRQSLKNARVQPEQVSYIEAHGTGTQLGDPIEVGALTTVFGCSRSEPLWIGSVKTNIGHLEPASGIAGLIKVVLSLQEKQIPPSLHFNNPNPFINWDASPVQVPTRCIPWSTKERIAGVSSFGMSGTNCHLIVEEAPVRQHEKSEKGLERPRHILMLSAKNEAALNALAARYVAFLHEAPATSLADLCYSANVGRHHFGHRLSVSSEDVAQLVEQLENYPQRPSVQMQHNVVPDNRLSPQIAFLFTGQGAQYIGMGRELYETQPTFRRTMDDCDGILRPLLGVSILDILYDSRGTTKSDSENSPLDQTAYTQPALFALEYALAKLWMSWGVEPDAVLGHSVGEYVAACLAGVFSLEDGLKLIAARGRLMQDLPRGEMLSVRSGEKQVEAIIAPCLADVSIAAVNGPQSVVISGKGETIQKLAEQFASKDIKTQQLTVSHAFHSPMMIPMLDAFRDVAGVISYTPPNLPLISNITGQLATDEVATPDYWVRHVREAVRFADSVATLQEENVDIFLEVGPKPILLGLARQVQSESGSASPPLMLPSLREQGGDWQQMLSTCGQLHVNGVEIDWAGFDKDYPRHKVLLPTYPFQRERHWVNLTAVRKQPPAKASDTRLDKMIRLPLENKVIFETEFSLQKTPYMIDHKIMGEVVVPGACFVSMMFNSAQVLFLGEAHELKDIIFHQPLVLGADEKHTVQTILTIEDLPHHDKSDPSVSMMFKIISFPATSSLNEEPKIHATGTLGILHDRQPTAIPLDHIRHNCPRPITQDQWYSRIVQTGIILGPSFGWITELWRGEDTYLGRLRLPRCVGNIQGNPLHLALLDSCLIVADDMDDNRSATKLPLSLDSVQLYGAATGDEWWCYAQKVENGKFNFQLLDKTGQVIAKAIGFADKEAPAEKFFRKDGPHKQDHRILWHSQPQNPDPLWAKMLRLPSENKMLFETGYSLQQLPYMAELEIFGQAILPISYSVSLLVNAAHALFPDAIYELTDLVFQKPLPINEGEEHTLQAIFSTEPMRHLQADGRIPGIDFQLLTFLTHNGVDGSATIYAFGSLSVRQHDRPKFLAIDELLTRCKQSATFDDWYPWVSKKGYTLGPYFYKWIDSIWRGEDETLTRLRLPEVAGSVEGHQLYFALFHGCIMATNLLFLHEDLIVRTPYAMESMHIYGPATGDEWWCYAQRIGKSKYNFQILNGRGLVVAEIFGYSEREVLHEETIFKERDRYNWLYQVGWQPQTSGLDSEELIGGHQSIGEGRILSGSCLILSDESSARDVLAERLAANGVPATVMHNVIAQSPADVEPLLRTLPDLQQAVHLWGVDPKEDGHPMKQAQDNCTALLYLVQSLLNTYATPPALLIVTRNAQAVVEQDRVNGFVQSSVWGLAKVIMLEHPELRCVCMDVGTGYSPEDVADTIFAQLKRSRPSSDQQESQLAWRNGQAYVARLSRYEHQSRQPLGIRNDSCYLITGGRGGVGLQVARWLVGQGAKHLVLLGRSQPNPEVRLVLDELEEAGAEIIAATADISDENALAQILAGLTTPLRGVIHAAGVLDDASLLQQTPAKLKKVLMPKVQGAWNLHNLTIGQPLDFFVLFSSASSLLGAPGQANYAAANAFLDGLAAYRQGLGLPGLSINWGAWDEVGMAAQQGLLDKLQQMGEEAIPLQKGLALFGELLNEPAAQIGVMPIQWPRFLNHQKGNSPFYDKFSKPSNKQASHDSGKEDIQTKLRQAAPQGRPKLLEAHLRSQVAQLLGINVAELPTEEGVGFVTLGLDSLNSIDLRNSLQRTLDCSLPVTFAFDYPTMELAAEYLTQIVLAPIEGAASQQADTSRTSPRNLDPASPGTSLDNKTDAPDSAPQKPVPDTADEDESLSAILQQLSKHLD